MPWADRASAESGSQQRDYNSELVYLLCTGEREVPRYLQSRLCQSTGTVRNTRFSGGDEVRLPTVPQFRFVQDNQYTVQSGPVFQERSLSSALPFSYISSSEDQTKPIIYSVAQSKVAVYKPNKQTPTTTTTTTTTSTTTTSTTIRPFHYKLPPSQQPQRRKNDIQQKQRQRPLVFNKRPHHGSGSVSRPFEYLSRLSQFLSDRVFTGRTKVHKTPGSKARPTLVTRRISDS